MKTTLVNVAELAANTHWRVFDCRHDLNDPDAGVRAYTDGHIPDAIHAHLDKVLSGPRTGHNGRHPLPDPSTLATWLGKQGVSTRDQLVIYDDSGGIFAARMWWLLRWLGHNAVAVLDGGLAAWRKESLPLTTKPADIKPALFQAASHDAAWVDVTAIEENLHRPHCLVIDARGAGRYAGLGETMDPRAGHIPGAINRPYTDNLNAVGRFKTPVELAEDFVALTRSSPELPLVAQCGSGVTACHNLLAMEVAGIRGARLYPGSWSEWCSDVTRPIRTGAQP